MGVWAAAVTVCFGSLVFAGEVTSPLEPAVMKAKQFLANGDLQRAETEYLSILGFSGPAVEQDCLSATAWNDLAGIYDKTGRTSEAQRAYTRALAIAEARCEDRGAAARVALNFFAHDLRTGQTAAAGKLRSTLDALADWMPPDADLGAQYNEYAGVFEFNRGAYEEAERLSLRALAFREKEGEAGIEAAANLWGALGIISERTGRWDEAVSRLGRALSLWERTGVTGHPALATDLLALGAAHVHLKNYAAAEPLLRRALPMAMASFGPESDPVADTWRQLAAVFKHTHRKREARQAAREADSAGHAAARSDPRRHTVSVSELSLR